VIRRLARDTAGGVGLIVAAAMPVLIGATALAVDLGAAMVQTRQLQGAADAAALAAAGDPAHGQALAAAQVASSGMRGTITTDATSGQYDTTPGIDPARRFAAGGGAAANAVRVTLTTPAPTYFARIFGLGAFPLQRTATAAQINLASFSLGSRLASLNGGVVNQYLSALTGSSLSLSVMDYNALASANVDLFGFLDALRSTAALSAGSYNSTLGATITTGQLLSAAATAAQNNGDIAAAAALTMMRAQSPSRSLQLGALIDPGLLGDRSAVEPGTTTVNLLDLVTAALQTASPTRQVSLDLGASVPGVTSTKLIVAIGERPEHSPWLAVTSTGTPVLRTAQARIYADLTIGGVSLPGVGGLVAIRVPLYVELASAEARLKAIDCSSGPDRGVTIEARTGPGSVAIGTIDTGRLQDFTTPLTVSRATLVHALLLDVTGQAEVDLGAMETWQTMFFDAAQVAAADVETVSSGSATQGLAESLIRNLHLQVSLTPLIHVPLDPLTAALGSALMGVAPALDTLVDTVTSTIGIHYGEAVVRATGMRCGTPALVG
jgi:uncharacterized membrane protein